DAHTPLHTARSCMDCHDKQGHFWQGTSHSLAYLTLVRVNERNNMACLKCHTLGAGQPDGFMSANALTKFTLRHSHDGSEHSHEGITFDQELAENEKVQLAQVTEQYWKDVFKATPVSKSLRTVGPKEMRAAGVAWQSIDSQHGVTHNFANVQ